MHKFGQPEIEHANAGDGGAQKAATAKVDGVRHGSSLFWVDGAGD
jgi:hypothetical protein